MVDFEWDWGVDEMDMVEGKSKSGRSWLERMDLEREAGGRFFGVEREYLEPRVNGMLRNYRKI
jgi:hypothetical protein